MILRKTSYFQGTDNPTPKKKKYKAEPAIVVQPRFKEPFYNNYDLYETEGLSGTAKHGPGSGWNSINKYKSIKDFLKSRRKNIQDKYKSDDSWIQDDGSITKRQKDAYDRMIALSIIVKKGIDFLLDEQVSSDPIPTSGSYIDSIPIGGVYDQYVALNDFEGKSIDQLNHHEDYVNEIIDEKQLKKFEQKYKI